MGAPPTQQQIEASIKKLLSLTADIEAWMSALIGEQLMLAQQFNININFRELVGDLPIMKDKYYYLHIYGCQQDAEKADEGIRKVGLK